jgi:hypothetical protein
MASSEPSRKRGREEVPLPLPAEPEEVPLPPPEEVKPTPPQRKVVRQPVVPLRAPKVDFQDASFSVKMLYEAWQSLGKMAIHLGVQRLTDPLETTVMDYTIKVNVFAWQLEREVVPHIYDDDGGLDVSSSDSDSDGGAPPAVTTSA